MSNSSPFQPESTGVTPPYAQPLEYHEYVKRGKPGLVTAVGIISIILGAFGALSSLSSITQGVMFGIVMPRTATRTVMMPPPPTVVATVPATAPATAASAAPASTAAPAAAPAGAMSGSMTVAVTPGGPAPATPFPFEFDTGTTALVLTEGTIGLGLAVFLFVLGILTLRGSHRARRGHLFWAWMKLPAAVLGGVSAALMTQAVFSGMAGMNTGPGAPPPFMAGDAMAIIQAVFTTGLACIYPIAILIVMRTKRVRAYYDAGAGNAAV